MRAALPPAHCRDGPIDAQFPDVFLTVNAVFAEDCLLLWHSRTRPTRATSGMGASTHRVDPRRDRSNGPKNEPARGREHASPAWPPFASFADRCTSLSDNRSQIKSTFRMRRSAAAGATPPARPSMHPEGVLAVVCLDNPRDNTRGKALWTALPSPGPQEECPWRL